VTLDPDLAARLKALARESGVSFKEALNSVLRRGLAEGAEEAWPYRLPTRDAGLRPGIDLTKALRLAAELEDAETIRKLELEHGAELCSADADFSRFAGLRWVNPLEPRSRRPRR
jgi:hypothetical protein